MRSCKISTVLIESRLLVNARSVPYRSSRTCYVEPGSTCRLVVVVVPGTLLE